MLRSPCNCLDVLLPRSGGVELDVVTKVAGEAETRTSFAMMR